jgi:hypothetical protein
MSEQLESAVREAFFAESELAPEPNALARAVRRRARRRPLVIGTAAAASIACAAGLAVANPFASTRPAIAVAHQTGALPSSGDTSCVEAYSAATLRERAFAFDGTVTRTVPVAGSSFPLVAVSFDVHEWFRGGSGSTTTIEMSPPAPLARSTTTDEIFDSYGVGTRLLVSGEPRWPGRASPEPIAWSCGFTRYYDDATAATWREAFGS